MFVDFKHSKYLGYNDKTRSFDHLHILEDTDFQVELHLPAASHLLKTQHIISVYEKRKQDVALNVVLYILHLKRKLGFEINQTIMWLYKYLPMFRKHSTEVDKYLAML